MSLTKCIRKAGKALDRDDADAITALRDGLVRDGVGATEAATQATRLYIEEVVAERQAIADQAIEQGASAPDAPVMENYEATEAGDAPVRNERGTGAAEGSPDADDGAAGSEAAVGDTADGAVDTNGADPVGGESVSDPDAAADEQPALSKPTARIDDFGEKIGGARKDYYGRLQDAKEKDTASVTLAESWPEPDYRKLLDSGVPADAVAMVHAMRDEIPPKPRKRWKLRGWVEQVETMRDWSGQLLDGSMSATRLKEKMEGSRSTEGVAGRIDLYSEFGHGQSLKGISFKKVHWSMYMGEEDVTLWMIDRSSASTGFGNMPRTLAKADTKAGAIEAFRKVYSNLADKKAGGKTAIRFDVYTDRDTKEVFIGKKIGSDVVRVKRNLGSVKAARDYMTDSQADLESALDKIKFIPNHRKETNAPRVGANHRNNGDVSEAEFAEAFGFHGVEFGNSVEQGRRQADLNRSYDALMDMAGILGIPSKALSLNGELGLAFGARGKGGKGAAVAHYESGKIVINLTKREGAGSLAHEWFHALDNYFSRERGGRSGASFATEGMADVTTRPEVAAAMREVINAVSRTGIRQRSKALDKVRTKAYWSTEREMAARAFESYVIEKLKDHSASNDYLANIVSEEYWKAAEALGMEESDSFPYAEAAEIPEIRAAFDNLFNTIETRETELNDGRTGVEVYSRGNAPANAHDQFSLTESMDRAFPGTFAALEKAGLARIVTRDQLPENVSPVDSVSSQGRVLAYVQDGKVTFVADNIAKGHNVRGLMLHEIGVHLRQMGQDDAGFQKILTQFEGLSKIKGSKASMAMSRVPSDTPASLKVEEGLGYLVELNPDVPLAKRLVAWFKEQLRKWLGDVKGLDRSRLMKWANGLSEADMVTMATAAVKSGPAASRQGSMASATRDTWYKSALSENVGQISKIADKKGMVGAQQAKDWLNAQAKRGLFKPDELAWVGVTDWLDMQTGKVSVESIQAFVDGNGVQVQDAILGYDGVYPEGYYMHPQTGDVDTLENWRYNLDPDELSESGMTEDEALAGLIDVAGERAESGKAISKYDDYQMPGGDNYREVLLTLPSDDKEIYDSPHWEVPNVIAHIRMNDRTDADGNKVLFVEEIQSDWAQEGRIAGFNSSRMTEADYKKLRLDAEEVVRHNDRLGFDSTLEAMRNIVRYDDWESRWDISHEGGHIERWRQAQLGRLKIVGAPFVGKTDAWVSLAMKRVIAMAADGGYDKVAFVNGEQSAERYSLSKKVGSIEYGRAGDSQYSVFVTDLAGVGMMEQTMGEADLEANFGKDIAKKIVDGGSTGKIEGEGLSVGGDGMKSFYDQIVPKVAQNVLKKLGGGKLGSSTFDSGSQASFDITDAMRQKVQEGLPLFSREGQTESPNILYSRAEAESPDSRENMNRRMREEHHGIWFKAKQMARREFLPGGLLPKAVFEDKIKRDSKMGAVEMDVTKHVTAVELAFKKDFGKSFESRTKAQELMMRDSLSGEPSPDMPERTAAALEAMRQYIDRYSEQYVEVLREDGMRLMDGMDEAARTELLRKIADEELDSLSGAEAQIAQKVMLMQTIASNVGEYVHRSYRAFDDPMWARAVPDAVLNNARDYLEAQHREKNPESTDAEAAADRVIEGILKEGTAFDSLESYIRESKLGAKDLSLLKRRKQIAPEMRALLGEHTDPRVNFAKTATKMTSLIHNDAFLKQVRKNGLGVFLFEDGTQPAGTWKTIAAEGNEAYAPLNGLKTTPEVNQALIDALGKENMEGWFRVIVQINGAVKFGKTVLSPTTAARNFMSASFFTMANGHSNLAPAWKSLKMHLNKTGDNFDYLRELKELGVVYDTPYAEEMMRLLRDTDMEDRLLNNKMGLKHLLDTAQAFYRFGDDFWKVIGFENEVVLIQKHYNLPMADARIKAAERIRNTYPTYSMTGRFVNRLRRFPLAGTFVSFPAEIIRTSFHILQYAAQDMAQSKTLGARRMVGLGLAGGLIYAAQEISKRLLGVDDDEEEAVREQLPEWSKNSNLYFLSREDGNLRYIDLSFLDPYNYWKRPLTAVMRDKPVKDQAIQAAAEMLSPFFGTDIAFGAIAEIWNNKRSSGGQVYNKSDSAFEQTKSIGDHLRKAVQPGAFANLERILKAGRDERTVTGRTYSMEDEMAALAGFRVSTLDPGIALKYRSFSIGDQLRDATSIVSRVVRNPNKVSDEDLRDAFDRASRVRAEAYKEMQRAVKAAERSGLDKAALFRQLQAGGMSKRDAAMLADGKVPPKLSSKQYLMSAVRSAGDTFGPEVQKEMNRRRLQILRWEREQLRRQ